MRTGLTQGVPHFHEIHDVAVSVMNRRQFDIDMFLATQRLV